MIIFILFFIVIGAFILAAWLDGPKLASKPKPKYSLSYDDCDHTKGSVMKWEGPGSFGEWRCAGCGVYRGGL